MKENINNYLCTDEASMKKSCQTKKIGCYWSNFAAKLNCKQSWDNTRKAANQLPANVPAKTAVTAAKPSQQERNFCQHENL